MAKSREVPMYRLFYEGEESPKLSRLPKRKSADDIAWGSSGKEARLLTQFLRLFSRMAGNDVKLLFSMAQKMARKNTD